MLVYFEEEEFEELKNLKKELKLTWRTFIIEKCLKKNGGFKKSKG